MRLFGDKKGGLRLGIEVQSLGLELEVLVLKKKFLIADISGIFLSIAIKFCMVMGFGE